MHKRRKKQFHVFGVVTGLWTLTMRNRLLGFPRMEIDEEITRTAGELLTTGDLFLSVNRFIDRMDARQDVYGDQTDDSVRVGIELDAHGSWTRSV